MNTYERHRLYRLRKHRTRMIRRRVLTILGAAALVVAAWDILARLTPEGYAPPDPAKVGSFAAKEIASTAATSINTVHGTLKPSYRDDAKRAVLALFDTAAPSGEEVQAGTDDFSEDEDPAGGAVKTGDTDSDGVVEHTDSGNLIAGNPCFLDVGREPQVSEADHASQAAVARSAPLSFPTADTGLELLLDTAAALEQSGRKQSRRVLDILLIGLDSRLGSARGRADALHLVTVDFDAPQVRITSIPRGTHSDLGYTNEASNIIANVRSARGRTELQRRVARLCRRDSVPYYVEVGFSDAFGILELLGYTDPSAELQALRQRRDYQYGDHNRCYNQGLFIRSAILRLLPLLEGVTGDVLLRAGLDLAHTNLTQQQCRGIAYLLNDAGVTCTPQLISVTLKSPYRKRIERQPGEGVYAHAVPGIDYEDLGGRTRAAELHIREALTDASADAGFPQRVRDHLWVLFRQHGWLQISDREMRRRLRDSLAICLLDACTQLGNAGEVREIRRTVEADDILFYQAEPSLHAAGRGR